jgi:hypothetical protein
MDLDHQTVPRRADEELEVSERKACTERRNQIFEAACHEGNEGLSGILAGARAIEKEKAEADRKGSKRKVSR